jgi:hypothetical protein
VHAAEHDEFGVGVTAHQTGELVGVAGVVGELDHFVALIVVTEDDQTAAERPLRGEDAPVHFLVRQREVAFRQRLPLAEVFFLVGRQDRN